MVLSSPIALRRLLANFFGLSLITVPLPAHAELVDQFVYAHSMWAAGTPSNDVPFWLDAMIEEGDPEIYRQTKSAGPDSQLPTYTYPPTEHWNIFSWPTVTPIPGLATDGTWAGYNQVNQLILTPDNFDSWPYSWPDDPTVPQGAHAHYVVGYNTIIQAWESSAPYLGGTRRYAIYQSLARFYEATNDDIAQATQTDMEEWTATTTSRYRNWYTDLHQKVQAANPTLDIELWRIAEVVSQTIEGIPALDTLAPSDLFLDTAPHHNSTTALLSSAVIYMYMFGRVPDLPASAASTHSVNPALTSNWTTIMDYAWALVQVAAPTSRTHPL